MERNNIFLPVILVVVIVIVLLLVFAGGNTFQMGQISFEYPNGWSQISNVGDFNNGTLYSEVTFTSTFENADGMSQDAYIIIQMQQKAQSSLNLPSTNYIPQTLQSDLLMLQISQPNNWVIMDQTW